MRSVNVGNNLKVLENIFKIMQSEGRFKYVDDNIFDECLLITSVTTVECYQLIRKYPFWEIISEVDILYKAAENDNTPLFLCLVNIIPKDNLTIEMINTIIDEYKRIDYAKHIISRLAPIKKGWAKFDLELLKYIIRRKLYRKKDVEKIVTSIVRRGSVQAVEFILERFGFPLSKIKISKIPDNNLRILVEYLKGNELLNKISLE